MIQWWDYAAHAFGLTIYHLFAIPNAGAGASRGQAGKMKAEGARSGIPDLFLAAPGHDGAHGLFVEMKRRVNSRTSFGQDVAMKALSMHYRCVVAYGADEAIAAIRGHLTPPRL